MSETTGVRVTLDCPRSPFTAWVRYCQNCTGQRLIEAQLVPRRLVHLGRGLRADERGDRVDRRHLLQREHREDEDEQDGDRAEQAPGQDGEHQRSRIRSRIASPAKLATIAMSATAAAGMIGIHQALKM